MTSTSEQYIKWLQQGAELRVSMRAELDAERILIEQATARAKLLEQRIAELDSKLDPVQQPVQIQKQEEPEDEAPPTPVSGVECTPVPIISALNAPTKPPERGKPLSATIGDHLIHHSPHGPTDQRLVRVPRRDLLREQQDGAEVIHLRPTKQELSAAELADLTNANFVLVIVDRLGVSTTSDILKEAKRIGPERGEDALRSALSWLKQKQKIDAVYVDATNPAMGFYYSPKPQSVSTG